MSKTIPDLCAIMRAGGSVRLTTSKTTADCIAIARAGAESGASLTLAGAAANKTTPDLCSIARANPGRIFFEFE